MCVSTVLMKAASRLASQADQTGRQEFGHKRG